MEQHYYKSNRILKIHNQHSEDTIARVFEAENSKETGLRCYKNYIPHLFNQFNSVILYYAINLSTAGGMKLSQV